MANSEHFPEIFERLKAMFDPFRDVLTVQKDEGLDFRLESSVILSASRRAFFGGVIAHKGHVGYYLQPIYEFPDIAATE